MNKKEQQKLQREHQEDAVLNKVLIWIVGAVVLEFLMLLLNRYYVHYTPATISLAMTLRSVFRVLAVALPVCAVALGVWCFSLYKKGKSVRLAGFLTVLGAALALCAVAVAVLGGSGIRLLYIGIPAVTVLMLIYYLYQREFFVSAALSAMGLLGVYLIPRTELFFAVPYIYAAAAAVVLAAVLLLCRKLQSGKGNLSVKGKTVEVFAKSAKYAMVYTTCGVVAAVMIAACFVGNMALLYGILAAWLLIMAVYYTVQLM